MLFPFSMLFADVPLCTALASGGVYKNSHELKKFALNPKHFISAALTNLMFNDLCAILILSFYLIQWYFTTYPRINEPIIMHSELLVLLGG